MTENYTWCTEWATCTSSDPRQCTTLKQNSKNLPTFLPPHSTETTSSYKKWGQGAVQQQITQQTRSHPIHAQYLSEPLKGARQILSFNAEFKIFFNHLARMDIVKLESKIHIACRRSRDQTQHRNIPPWRV